MEPLYILFVSAGGVFLVLFFALLGVSFRHWSYVRSLKKDILRTYSDKNLAKMEYDFAFYDGESDHGSHSDSAKQVTIDDVFSGDGEDGDGGDELSRFRPIGEVKDNVVVGNYNPEKSND